MKFEFEDFEIIMNALDEAVGRAKTEEEKEKIREAIQAVEAIGTY